MKTQGFVAKWVAIAVLVGAAAANVSPRTAEAQVVSSKRCTNCRSQVAISSQVGGSCPYCGAYWGYETYDRSSGDSSQTGYQPQSDQQSLLAFWQAMALQQKVLERQQRLARMEQIRQDIATGRESTRQRIRERAEEARGQDNPERRAQNCLEAAHRSEADGNVNAAAAFYRHIVRYLPDTSVADEATLALSRLALR